ncbi:POU domain, class 2, transcription factor 1, variant 2 [Dermatophagoides farinae]|uniref:POU domain, class 2, transcription factor 1, variant 2 n=1 Tax=Dermatophagoides farinae TaxID=6954 RepID=A0A922IBT2_DERFA|nr:POU domain, class 2, transcription factor 1, variant 2 [Dermatophagoides farinae]
MTTTTTLIDLDMYEKKKFDDDDGVGGDGNVTVFPKLWSTSNKKILILETLFYMFNGHKCIVILSILVMLMGKHASFSWIVI